MSIAEPNFPALLKSPFITVALFPTSWIAVLGFDDLVRFVSICRFFGDISVAGKPHTAIFSFKMRLAARFEGALTKRGLKWQYG
jgi:hypothetical protein